jgi:hypothetical protein
MSPGIALVPNQEAGYLVFCKRSGFEDESIVVHAREERESFRQWLGSTEIRNPGGASISLALKPKARAAGF